MKIITLSLSSLAMAGFLSTSAQAEMKFYSGVGIAYSSTVSSPGLGATLFDSSVGDLFGLGLTTGVRFGGGNLFYGAELDADVNIGGAMTYTQNGLSCADGFADAPYICSQGSTIRLRAVFGTDIQGYEVFGTVGYGVMFGSGATGADGSSAPVTLGGLTYGIGAQHTMGAGKIRAEVIWDDLDTIIDNPTAFIFDLDWAATTAKVSYIIEF